MRKKNSGKRTVFSGWNLAVALSAAIHSTDLSPQQRFQNNGAGFLCGRL